ncbi:TPA: hypothetical protein ACQN3S_001745, partial [Streptococcus pyogenes]
HFFSFIVIQLLPIISRKNKSRQAICLSFFSQNRSQFIFDEMRWQPITPLSKSLEALFRKC